MNALRNEDAERAILGAILLDNAAYAEASKLRLKPTHFSLDSHGRIFARMGDLAKSGRPIDTITLPKELNIHKELQAVGDVAYLTDLMRGVPERPSIASYVNIVIEAAKRMLAAKQIEKAGRAVSDPNVSASALANMLSAVDQFQEEVVQAPEFSEDALALRFSDKYADDFRYVYGWEKWMQWDGTRWTEDRTLHVFDLARGVCREVSAECRDSQKKQAVKLASKATSAAVERFAAADRRHAATVEQWDSDPWLLNTPSGTIDLRTGEVRAHRRTEYLTKITAVESGGDCVLWRQFLHRVTGGDSELQGFLQRMAGYCLTGVTSEHALFFLYGTGANGKSVFLRALSSILGDYAKTAPVTSFTASAAEQHPTDLAGLRGARFVTAIETDEGTHWAEAKIKSLTGGDKIAARFMRCDFFEFCPEFKLLIAGNHKPSLQSVDEAIRRRFHLVPFGITIPEAERDLLLDEKLQAEFPGVLSWAVQGCLDWQTQGLNPPSAVRDATASYLAAEDAIGRWLDERCLVNISGWASSAVLFIDWKRWCEANGENFRTQRWFVQQLEGRGIKPQRTSRARGFIGLELQKGLVTQVTHQSI